MKTVQIATKADLEAAISHLDRPSLFRGQRRHYVDDDDRPSIVTSMHRQGCKPPLQHKWSRYAEEVLRALSFDKDRTVDLNEVQAVLQHYGWRSFFIDATASPAVASWFAGHQYSENLVLEMAQDCFEHPLVAAHTAAEYQPNEGEAVLYVFSMDRLRESNMPTFDLSVLTSEDCRLRPQVQEAWLVGVSSGKLPSETISHAIHGPANAFAEYALDFGFATTPDLFPGRHEDPILALLLAVPWTHIPIDGQIEGYCRGLPLPEHDLDVIKTYPPWIAFVRDFWISDKPREPGSPISDATFFRVPETAFYVSMQNPSASFPTITAELRKRGTIVLESEGLLGIPEFHPSNDYMKGLHLVLDSDGCAKLSEVSIEHPGREPAGIGLMRHWTYEIQDDGLWQRSDKIGQCECNNYQRHEANFRRLAVFEDFLSSGWFDRLDDETFVFNQ
ncbi:MAG: FRG domain-containing protein [Euryarchaeota archaeon]|nr:FRG domain-containing protein [Euryarchaeota archaeon]